MTSRADDTTPGPRKIVPLRAEPTTPEPPAKPKGLSRIHGTATVGMALCAFTGIFALLALITVRWPGGSNRFVVAILLGAAFGFLLCGSIAVFSAARDTYVNGATGAQEEERVQDGD